MAEYIEREAMQMALHELRLRNVYREMMGRIYEDTISLAFLSMADIPAADVAPVRHGHWYDKGSLSCRCSECGCKNNRESRYCPICGAKMDGGDDHAAD